MKPNNSAKDLRKIVVAAGQIVLTDADQVVCQIPVKALKLIGEFTTSAGPWVDDWYIVFMTSEQDWTQISEYTPGMLEVLQELGVQLQAEVMGSLAHSITWKTNIIWPQVVANQEMWDVITENPTTLFGKLKKVLGFANQRLVLTEAAASVFR